MRCLTLGRRTTPIWACWVLWESPKCLPSRSWVNKEWVLEEKQKSGYTNTMEQAEHPLLYPEDICIWKPVQCVESGSQKLHIWHPLPVTRVQGLFLRILLLLTEVLCLPIVHVWDANGRQGWNSKFCLQHYTFLATAQLLVFAWCMPPQWTCLNEFFLSDPLRWDVPCRRDSTIAQNSRMLIRREDYSDVQVICTYSVWHSSPVRLFCLSLYKRTSWVG